MDNRFVSAGLMAVVLMPGLAALLGGGACSAPKGTPMPEPVVTATFTNPVVPIDVRAGADPAVIWHDGLFYFYSTNSGLNVFTSPDLVNWTRGPKVLPDSLKGTWAPEVYRHPEDGRFYMYYTHRYKIGVAVSDRPDAMFRDLGWLVIDAIDAHMFRDDDGRLYLYFTQTPSFTTYCVPMRTPIQTGGPITKCFEISADWERLGFAINEGPWMLKRDGVYYLLYSGGDGQSVHYAVGYATAATPIGPFTKHAGNPVFQDRPAIRGPGHGSVIADRAGQLWHLYHQKVSDEKGWARDICLDPVDFDERGVFGGKPTRGVAQRVPQMDAGLVWVPEISPRGAVFRDRVEVTLGSRAPGATLRYTLDGSEPTEASPRYERPIALTASAVVTARAWKAGMRPSASARMRFSKTEAAMPENPAPAAEPGKVGFLVFPEPDPKWQRPPRPATQPATRPATTSPD